MRKRLFAALLILLVCAIVALTIFHFSRPTGVTLFGYARVSLGMTSEEVEAVIGVPPGNYSSREDIKIVDHWASEWHMGHQPEVGNSETWYSDDGCLCVIYSSEGKVVFKQWKGMVDHRPSFFERMKAQLGW
jgi:hypothetical protein